MSEGASEQIMMPVDKPDALAMAEIHAIRAVADAVTAQSRQFGEAMGVQTRTLEKVSEKVDDVRERVIRLEEQKHGQAITAVKEELKAALARIDTLESQRDQAKGAAVLWAWISKNMPWLVPFMVATGVILADRVKKP